MIGWLIVAVVSLVGVVLVNIWSRKIRRKYGEDWADEQPLGKILFFVLVAGVVYALLVISIVASISSPITAKQQYLEFENTRIIVQQSYENGTANDNTAVTNTVISANKWLAQAKANKQVYGIFSKYYFIDFENIDPIQLQRSEEQCQEIFQNR